MGVGGASASLQQGWVSGVARQGGGHRPKLLGALHVVRHLQEQGAGRTSPGRLRAACCLPQSEMLPAVRVRSFTGFSLGATDTHDCAHHYGHGAHACMPAASRISKGCIQTYAHITGGVPGGASTDGGAVAPDRPLPPAPWPGIGLPPPLRGRRTPASSTGQPDARPASQSATRQEMGRGHQQSVSRLQARRVDAAGVQGGRVPCGL